MDSRSDAVVIRHREEDLLGKTGREEVRVLIGSAMMTVLSVFTMFAVLVLVIMVVLVVMIVVIMVTVLAGMMVLVVVIAMVVFPRLDGRPPALLRDASPVSAQTCVRTAKLSKRHHLWLMFEESLDPIQHRPRSPHE